MDVFVKIVQLLLSLSILVLFMRSWRSLQTVRKKSLAVS